MIPSKLIPKSFRLRIVGACASLLLASLPAHADLIELVNGDHYNGTVIGMNPTQLEFRSEIQGVVKIPRDKVARITLREAVATKPTAAVTPVPANTPIGNAAVNPVVARTNGAAFRPAFKAASAAQPPAGSRISIDPAMVSQIHEQVIGNNSPEATGKFNQMVASMMAGSLSVEDIRTQARNAIRDIQSAKGDLGPEADMLNGYLKILQDFVNDPDASGLTAQKGK